MSLVERMMLCGMVVPLALLCSGSPLLAAQKPSPEQRIFELTNAERARAGCPAMRLNGDLSEAAAKHSADMAHQDFFGHSGTDGRTPRNAPDLRDSRATTSARTSLRAAKPPTKRSASG